MAALFASAGTQIRDDEGNLVATLTRDVFAHEIVSPEQFRLPDGSTPSKDAIMPRAVARFINRPLKADEE